MLMVDISNYSGLLVEGVLDRWYDRGVRAIAVQAINPPPGYPPRVDVEQCDEIVADGRFALIIYGFHWTGTDLLRRNVQRIADADYPVYRYCGDFEDALTNAAPFVRSQEIRDVMEWLDTLPSYLGPISYTGEWWTDGYLPSGTTCMEGYDQWLSKYDHQEIINVSPVAGATRIMAKQHWGTLTFEGQPNCDLSIVAPEEEQNVLDYLASRGQISPAPEPEPTPSEPPAQDVQRETPAEYPWPTWYESAVNYKAIADELGQQIARMRCAVQPKGA